MESKQNNYKISFFRPTTRHARIDRNMVLIFLCIWAMAVFGFHIALRILEKPTPERALSQFEEVFEKVKEEKANSDERVQYIHALLTCLGKQSLTDEHRAVLQNDFSLMLYGMYPETLQEELDVEVSKFLKIKENITSLSDEGYVNAKRSITEAVASVIEIKPGTVQYELIPFAFPNYLLEDFSKDKVHSVMKLYMTHNQSVLTNTKFLGFPFHYFYTAVFLLILFVLLCWSYCVILDRVNGKLGVRDDNNI